MTDRGIGRGDVIEAMQLCDVTAQCATHDQPHDELNALRAAFADIFEVRDPPQRAWIRAEIVIVRLRDQLPGGLPEPARVTVGANIFAMSQRKRKRGARVPERISRRFVRPTIRTTRPAS